MYIDSIDAIIIITIMWSAVHITLQFRRGLEHCHSPLLAHCSLVLHLDVRFSRGWASDDSNNRTFYFYPFLFSFFYFLYCVHSIHSFLVSFLGEQAINETTTTTTTKSIQLPNGICFMEIHLRKSPPPPARPATVQSIYELSL